ncbi:MAG: ribosome maturation factor RimM, partial [Bradymonadia bacterium]
LTGQRWFCSRAEFKPLSDDEIYVADLIGMTVLGIDDDALGTVNDVIEVGPNLILVIRVGHREVMVPYVDEFVSGVSLESKQLTVRVIEGLLETGRA